MFWKHLGYNFQIWSLVNYCNSALRETTPTLATYHVHYLCNDLIAAYGYSHFHRFNCRRLRSDSFVPLFRHASPVLVAINYRRRCGWLADVAARGVRLFSYCACVMAGLRLANATWQCAYQCYVHAPFGQLMGIIWVMYTTLTRCHCKYSLQTWLIVLVNSIMTCIKCDRITYAFWRTDEGLVISALVVHASQGYV